MQLMYGEGVKRAVRFQNESQIEALYQFMNLFFMLR